MKKLFGIIMCAFFLIGKVHGSEVHLTDIENHWAKDNIIRMAVNETIQGYPDNTFRPDNYITALEFVKILMDTLHVPLLEEGLHHWPDDYVITAKQYQIECDETQLLTRYDVVDILAHFVNLQSVTSSSKKWKDVDVLHQANVSKVYKLKIMEGYQDGTFRGKEYLTRAEAVVIIQRTVDAKQELANRNKSSLTNKNTNIMEEAVSYNSKKQALYEIKQGSFYFYDSGRYANLSGETFKETNISQRRVLQLLNTLVSDNTYVALFYVPSPYMMNQIIIRYGENKEAIQQNMEFFTFTYFEDENYNLKQNSFQEVFTSNCYMKIQLKKMWKERYEFENNLFIEQNLEKKLLDALKIEFKEDAETIEKIMVEKYMEKMVLNNQIVETVTIGNYVINIYQTDAMGLEFYFEKLS